MPEVLERHIETIMRLLDATAEILGQDIKPTSLAVMAEDLSRYSLLAIEKALRRVRRECHRMTLAAVIERLEQDDGRPGPDEAWALAVQAVDETATIVWTKEVAEAWGIAIPILESGDKVGARMAFREAYERTVRHARESGSPVRWQLSLGTDTAQREETARQAVESGKLAHEHVAHLLPPPEPDAGRSVAFLPENKETRKRVARMRQAVDAALKKTEEEREVRDRMRKARREAEEQERHRQLEAIQAKIEFETG
ncbi:MAG: hypothetical protein Kow0060_07890 [Methylohalobius crimeensis]